MKNLAVLISFSLLLAIAAGCERRQASEADPDIYDGDVDPPPSVLRHKSDPELLEDQSAISRRAERAAPAEPAAATPTAAASDPIEQVKGLMETTLEGLKAGKLDSFLALFPPKEADLLRPFVAGLMEAQQKQAELEELITTKLGIEMPASVTGMLGVQMQPPGMDMKLEDASIDDMQFELVDDSVIVTDPDGSETTFVSTDAGYRMSMGDQEVPEEIFQIMTELTEAEKKLVDQLIAGINDDTITAANLEQRAKEMSDELLGPVMAKMMGAMFSKMAESEGLPRAEDMEKALDEEEVTIETAEPAESGAEEETENTDATDEEEF